MIELQGVSKASGAQVAPTLLDYINFTVSAGEVVLISGATGSGKSTLLKMLYAAEFADRGIVRVFGRDLARLRRSSIPVLRRHVGVIPQAFSLLSELSALRNVALALEVRAASQRDMLMRASEALTAMGVGAYADTPVSQLSLGQRQQVAIARAIVGDPVILIADEPTAYLDRGGTETFIDQLIDIQSRGGAAVVATRDPSMIAASRHYRWRHLEVRDHTLHVIANRAPSLADNDDMASIVDDNAIADGVYFDESGTALYGPPDNSRSPMMAGPGPGFAVDVDGDEEDWPQITIDGDLTTFPAGTVAQLGSDIASE